MKKLVLTGIASLALALGAFAQGSINLDNSLPGFNFGLAMTSAGAYVPAGTTYGLEVWELSGATAVPAGIDITPAGGSGIAAYAAMVGAGFKLETTLSGQTTPALGTITIGEVDMPDVTPAGSTVVLGLAAWNTAATSWANMLGAANATTAAGVIAFLQPTANYKALPTPTPLNITGWNTAGGPGDLVMTSVPEPATFALAGLGAAALLIFRRRK